MPNDLGWFITSSLTSALYEDGRIEEIDDLIGNNIMAEDIAPWVLTVFGFSENEKGTLKLAKNYLSRSKANGFDRSKFESSFIDEDLRIKTVDILSKVGL